MTLRPLLIGAIVGCLAAVLGPMVGCRCDSGEPEEQLEAGTADTSGSANGFATTLTYDGPIIDPVGFSPPVENGQTERFHVTFGRPTVVGPLPRAEIEQVFSHSAAQLSFCYQSVLQVDPHLSGAVTVVFSVQSDGTVSNRFIEATEMENDDLGFCLLNEVASMRFPPPLSEALVTFPLLFEP